jgi:hypothetical protein
MHGWRRGRFRAAHPSDPDDVRLERIDVAPLNGNAVLPDMPLAGRTAARALVPGEPLRRVTICARRRSCSPAMPCRSWRLAQALLPRAPGKALTQASEGQSGPGALPGGKVPDRRERARRRGRGALSGHRKYRRGLKLRCMRADNGVMRAIGRGPARTRCGETHEDPVLAQRPAAGAARLGSPRRGQACRRGRRSRRKRQRAA